MWFKRALPPGAAAEFGVGVMATLPFIIGAIPFAVIYGAVATTTGLSVWETSAMSLFVFSGSAQFIAVTFMAMSAPAWVIWLATFILNVRHTLYAATLITQVRHLSGPWRLVLSALLTDETFATMEGYYRSTKRPQIAHWAFLGSCLSMYLNWNAWTLIAAFAGREMQGLAGTGLEFSVYAAFIGMVVPRLREKPAAIAALVAAIVAVVAVALPYKINITLAAVLGVLAATIAGERMRAGAST